MDTVSTIAELKGIALYAALVLALVRPCLELERLAARRRAGVTRQLIKAGVARYRRTREGNLRVVIHPSVTR